MSAPGYKTKIVPVDGKTALERIDLDPVAASKPASGASAPSGDGSKKPKHKCKPGDELCDPFG